MLETVMGMGQNRNEDKWSRWQKVRVQPEDVT